MRQTTGLVIVILVVLAVASLASNVYQFSFSRTATVTTTSEATTTTTVLTTLLITTSTTCIISGEPGGIFLRVLSDSTSQPVSGVIVTAMNTPYLCDGSPATVKTVDMFTTNGTEWRSLPGYNNYQYSFIANYQGHTFNFTATLEPVSMTCATLYLPSGRTNATTTEFGSPCQ